MASDFAQGLELKKEAANRPLTEQNNRLTVYQALKKSLDGADKMNQAMTQSMNQSVASVQQKIASNLDLSEPIDFSDMKSLEDIMERLVIEKEQMIALAEVQLADEEKWEKRAWKQLPEKQRLESSETMMELAKTNPEYYEKVKETLSTSVTQRNREMLEALKKDSRALVALTPTNAKDVDRKIREALAQKELLKAQDKWSKELSKQEERPIDELCINGGV
jgi:hypothetical protein